jgi:hypothetical protein
MWSMSRFIESRWLIDALDAVRAETLFFKAAA